MKPFQIAVKYLIDQHRFEFKEMTTVSEIFDTDEKHAVALEAVLGEALNYIVIKTLDEARRASALLKENKKGRATFIPLDQLAATYEVQEGSLFDHVKSKREYSALKQLLLGNVMVFETTDEAYKKLKGSGSLGRYLRWRSDHRRPFFSKAVAKVRMQGFRVGLKDKIEKLEKEEVKAAKEISNLEEYLEQIIEKYEKLDVSSLSQSLKEKEQEVRRLEQQQHSLSSKIQVYQKNITELMNRKGSPEIQ